MNRRQFLTALAAVPLARHVPPPPAAVAQMGLTTLLFKGVPIVYDEDCPSTTAYVINPNVRLFQVNRGL